MQPIHINLALSEPSDSRAPLGAAIILAVILLMATAYHGFLYRQNQLLLDEYRQKITRMDAALAHQSPADAGKAVSPADPLTDPAVLQETARQANRLIIADKFPWNSLLDALEKALPPGAVLDSILPAADYGSVTLKGRALRGKQVLELLGQLTESGLFSRNRLLEIGTNPEKPGTESAYPIRFVVQSNLMPASLAAPSLAAGIRHSFDTELP